MLRFSTFLSHFIFSALWRNFLLRELMGSWVTGQVTVLRSHHYQITIFLWIESDYCGAVQLNSLKGTLVVSIVAFSVKWLAQVTDPRQSIPDRGSIKKERKKENYLFRAKGNLLFCLQKPRAGRRDSILSMELGQFQILIGRTMNLAENDLTDWEDAAFVYVPLPSGWIDVSAMFENSFCSIGRENGPDQLLNAVQSFEQLLLQVSSYWRPLLNVKAENSVLWLLSAKGWGQQFLEHYVGEAVEKASFKVKRTSRRKLLVKLQKKHGWLEKENPVDWLCCNVIPRGFPWLNDKEEFRCGIWTSD